MDMMIFDLSIALWKLHNAEYAGRTRVMGVTIPYDRPLHQLGRSSDRGMPAPLQ